MDAKVAARVGAAAVGLGIALAAGSGVAVASPDASGSPSTSSASDASSADDSVTDSSSAAADDATSTSGRPGGAKPTRGETDPRAAADHGLGSDSAESDDDLVKDGEADGEDVGDGSPDASDAAHDGSEDQSTTHAGDTDSVDVEAPGAADTVSVVETDGQSEAFEPAIDDVGTALADTEVPATELGWLSTLLASFQRDFEYFVNGGGPVTHDPRQIPSNTYTGETFGGVTAVGHPRDWLTYRIIDGPLHGAVEMFDGGIYRYMPTAVPSNGIRDTFTVAVRNYGFNLRTVMALFNPSLNTTVVTVPVEVLALQVDPTAPLTIRRTYMNNTTDPIKLIERTNEEWMVFGPALGSVLLPGQSHTYIYRAPGTDYSSVLTYDVGWFHIPLSIDGTLHRNLVTCGATDSSVSCASGLDGQFWEASPATVELSADQREQQTAILDAYCYDGSPLSCSLRLISRESQSTYTDPHELLHVFNYGNSEEKEYLEITDTVSVKDSFATSFKVTEKIVKLLQLEVLKTYSYELTESHTFTTKTTIVIPGRTEVLYTQQQPVIRHIADMVVKYPNATWILRGVAIDEPDPSRVSADRTYKTDIEPYE